MLTRQLTESTLVLVLESGNLGLEKVLPGTGRSTRAASLLNSIVLLIILTNISKTSVRKCRDGLTLETYE
jgi:hypothetical protein